MNLTDIPVKYMGFVKKYQIVHDPHNVLVANEDMRDRLVNILNKAFNELIDVHDDARWVIVTPLAKAELRITSKENPYIPQVHVKNLMTVEFAHTKYHTAETAKESQNTYVIRDSNTNMIMACGHFAIISAYEETEVDFNPHM